MGGSRTTAERKKPRLQEPDAELASPKLASIPRLYLDTSGALGSITPTAGPMLQLQSAPTTQAPAPAPTQAPPQTPPISAATVFGLPVGSRVLLSGLVSGLIGRVLRQEAPDVAASLDALNGKKATVAEATETRFRAVLDEAVTMPGTAGAPARKITDLALTLSRNPDGTFDFIVGGRDGTNDVVLVARQGLAATRQGNAVEFLEAGVQSLRITPAPESGGEATVSAFTAPFAGQIPSWASSFVPSIVDLIAVARLPDAPKGSEAEKKAVEAATNRAAKRSEGTAATPNVISGGVGLSYGPATDFGFSASYRYNLSPVRSLGTLLQTPIEAQIYFTPSSSLIGSATGGIGTSLADLNIPVTVRLITGVGGGRVSTGERDPSGSLESASAFGPVLGAGAGLVFGSFRTEIQYQHLFNLADTKSGTSPDIGSLQLTLGRAF